MTKAEREAGAKRRGATLDYDLWGNLAHVRITWLECGHYVGGDHAPFVLAVFRELEQSAAFIPSLGRARKGRPRAPGTR